MNKNKIMPEYLFETSWEVCNKVGGIHTVISTKAAKLVSRLKNNYILIGPDVWRGEDEHPEFEEDTRLFRFWREKAREEGLRIKTGRWKIAGRPVAVLVDFTPFFPQKDQIFARFWETHKLDSLSGQWDYIEPALFGYAAGKVIESFSRFNITSGERTVAQFHEWMTGTGILYLESEVPHIATVFTTHATVVGRSLAGNNFPLYKNLMQYDAHQVSRDFNIRSKFSLEKLAAQHADVFTTVSEITSKECSQFLGKEVDLVTPNGFDDSFVPANSEFSEKRKTARDIMFRIVNAMMGKALPDNTRFVASSGRCEFRNKGIDLFIDALGKMNEDPSLERPVVAFLLIPAGHYGPRKDLQDRMANPGGNMLKDRYVTHHLHDTGIDLIMNRIRNSGLENNPDDKVKVIFVPCYLDGRDGIFNLSYYDLLVGMDLTVFPSYYEPWGYTPLESLAFHIPTVTTSLAGFGLWVRDHAGETDHAIYLLDRNDDNDTDVVKHLVETLKIYSRLSDDEFEKAGKLAFDISRIALWDNLLDYYYEAFHQALDKSEGRAEPLVPETPAEQILQIIERPAELFPRWKNVSVKSKLPGRLKDLQKLANNLWWTWDTEAPDLFRQIDPEHWENCEYNPLILFEQVEYTRLKKLAGDSEYVEKLKRVSDRFTAYMKQKNRKKPPRIAYFSMEFGLHESVKIYSGGLGILAGDYLKEASDRNADIIGIGLLYRYGYFKQMISILGEQHAQDDFQDFNRLPITLMKDENGKPYLIHIVLPGRNLYARIWKLEVGRVDLYLLDADLEENQPQDRGITHRLYGGSRETRLLQELLLGIGGIRALRIMNIKRDLFHSNEGHSAFIGVERIRQYIQEMKLTFSEAKEIVRASTLFTTHTPVPAGHDSFPEEMLRTYITHYADRLEISWDEFMGLGRMNPGNPGEEFNMSYLAINLSQEVNGVSELHGRVARDMFVGLYPGYLADELHIGHVTNGVHYPSWTAREWRELFFEAFGDDFEEHHNDPERWKKIMEVSDERIWKIKIGMKHELLEVLKERAMENWIKRHENPKHLVEVFEKMDPNSLTIGFARRFATYKRAHLIFMNLDRLARIVNDPKRPVQFLFAGKAHPHDKAGQDLIKRIVEISKQPEFLGKIIFLQNYDIRLASQLVQSVDVWMNTPTRPLEASGTSGMKAIINGTLHFSVLDGWWAEGYREGAGWALPEEKTYEDQGFQDEMDAETIYRILENEIIPAYYTRNDSDVPEQWVGFIKKSLSEVAPGFTTWRMQQDYFDRYYQRLYRRTTAMQEHDYQMAKRLVRWKTRFFRRWKTLEVVSVEYPEGAHQGLVVGQRYPIAVEIDLNDFNPEYFGLELIVSRPDEKGKDKKIHVQPFELAKVEGGKAWFNTKVVPVIPGSFNLGIRIFPKNDDLPHRQDFPYVKWI